MKWNSIALKEEFLMKSSGGADAKSKKSSSISEHRSVIPEHDWSLLLIHESFPFPPRWHRKKSS